MVPAPPDDEEDEVWGGGGDGVGDGDGEEDYASRLWHAERDREELLEESWDW